MEIFNHESPIINHQLLKVDWLPPVIGGRILIAGFAVVAVVVLRHESSAKMRGAHVPPAKNERRLATLGALVLHRSGALRFQVSSNRELHITLLSSLVSLSAHAPPSDVHHGHHGQPQAPPQVPRLFLIVVAPATPWMRATIACLLAAVVHKVSLSPSVRDGTYR